MEIFALTDAVSSITTPSQPLGFPKSLSHRQSTGILSISALLFRVDAMAPPTVRPRRTIRRAPPQKRRRTRKGSIASGDSDDGEDDRFFVYGNGDVPIGGGGEGGGGGGRGWNSDGKGGESWEGDLSGSSNFGQAWAFMNEVIYWIVLSICMPFAFNRMRVFAAGASGAQLLLRLVCL